MYKLRNQQSLGPHGKRFSWNWWNSLTNTEPYNSYPKMKSMASSYERALPGEK